MCLYPIKAYRLSFIDRKSGEEVSQIKIVKDNSKNLSTDYVSYVPLELPCGKCLECQKEYSKIWSFRIMLEAKKHVDNCFLTLTYADNPKTLVKRDLQLFLKRLRRRIEPVKIRFFACGEYGKKGRRPHYHLIIFGWNPHDLEFFFKDKQGNSIYKSKFVSDVWQKGFITVGELTQESAKYCAKYMQKLEPRYNVFEVKPFTLMSLKPGIGLDTYLENEDIYLKSDKIYLQGEFCKIPRYFLDNSKRRAKVSNTLIDNRILKSNLLKPSEEDLEKRRKRANDLLKL